MPNSSIMKWNDVFESTNFGQNKLTCFVEKKEATENFLGQNFITLGKTTFFSVFKSLRI